MDYKIVYGQRALESLENIDAYLSERSPSGARNVLAEIQYTVGLFGQFSALGRELHGLNMRSYITRRYKYRIVYRVTGQVIEILKIYHPSQRVGENDR